MIRVPEIPAFVTMPPSELPAAGVPSLLACEVDADVIAVAPDRSKLAAILTKIAEARHND